MIVYTCVELSINYDNCLITNLILRSNFYDNNKKCSPCPEIDIAGNLI